MIIGDLKELMVHGPMASTSASATEGGTAWKRDATELGPRHDDFTLDEPLLYLDK